MTIRVAPWLARLILMIPVVALCVFLRTSDFWVLLLYGLTWLWMYWQDTAVAKRWPHSTSPSNMMMRFWIWSTLGFFVVLFTVYGGYPPWAEILCHGFLLGILIGPFCYRMNTWTGTDYGGYWVTLPWPWNPDPISVRQGGFPEPQYTDFVPPDSWMYQCPNCGARVPESHGVCWRCNYGADGRSDAYVRRYGHQPPPRPQRNSSQQQCVQCPTPRPQQPPPPVGPYGPIDTNTP